MRGTPYKLDVRPRLPAQWQAMRERAMRDDYGWDRPARDYLDLYAAPMTPPA